MIEQNTQRGRKRFVVRMGFLLVTVAILASVYFLSQRNRSDPIEPTRIFVGVTYGCRILSRSDEGEGPMHWVRVDLTAPGIELYVTPIDPSAEATGYQYRLRRIGSIVRDERLAVVVNGALFSKEPSLGYWPGMRARGIETVVADGRVSHLWEHTYLAWFESDLKPHLERIKPPPQESLSRSKWGIGGQGVGLQDGRVREGQSRDPDSRTVLGIAPDRRLLFLAVFESVSHRRALEELAELGASEGMMLDGGGSTAMAIGSDATGVPPGVVLGGWRPVATYFGLRADPVR